MSLSSSPFAVSNAVPGEGIIELSFLQPYAQVLKELTYQYPLKLISPDPHKAPNQIQDPVTVVFVLNYGGGLVGGDKINLCVRQADRTKLVLLTQGSTKIFKSPARDVVSRQTLNVTLGKGSALCYLPDPTQPFGESVYCQRQTFCLDPTAGSSLCVLDWVGEGRKARGESWSLHSWKGKNEVRDLARGDNVQGRLLLRDTVMLSDEQYPSQQDGPLSKTDDMGVFGTLILYGPVFQKLSDFILNEFTDQPRIGAKTWAHETFEKNCSAERVGIDQRWRQEQADGLLWTAARFRGFVLVKFGAREVGGAKQWLEALLHREGTLENQFGHQALFCLR